MKVKICGIRSAGELDLVEKYADFTGVIVKSQSRRCISLEKAGELIDISSIPVFVVSTASFEVWNEIIRKLNPEFIQIHSEMPAEFVQEFRDMGLFIMKVFKVPLSVLDYIQFSEELVKKIESFPADLILLDSGNGSGKMHDLRVSREICRRVERKIMLAGGLNPQNVGYVVSFVNPYGVDVSSGVERDGKKDKSLIQNFLASLDDFEQEQEANTGLTGVV
ncbi:phosphoribosylanthranilate isomerase [Archaeoglobus sulfaticallidus PM70-1]|uniref:N-(5'-phosphoribosyl)anthranilate isomerase n=1 Tax=Archaeoglobus sulfaticallidus PM70-1 TaxID=387631 RepID=N0BEH2_9EURY|nr:phosphoribosylanthranilate isomerase [Archaeoglobus sulfaticallidus]AGK60667.1 phosphoribosylanthranilate isomerase [Archaeoglobus sulfaticallidus PM70-1]